MLQLIAPRTATDMARVTLLAAAVAALASSPLSSASAQSKARSSASVHSKTRPPFLRRDTPPTVRDYDNRDDTRDFQANGVFPGDFATRPGLAWLGAAGIIAAAPSTSGSHFGPIYCTRRYYRTRNPRPGYFQGDDGVWYRCGR
ncbi:MAG TPA: hypothetical protein VMU69_33170 [Bradyrhizobium sp.]|nr:hypothetical protein [Bradyrhizobium sp.]